MATTPAQRRASFRTKVGAALALVALGDHLFFFGGSLGGGIGPFAIAWLVATVLVHPALRRDRRAHIAVGAAAFYAVALYDDPSLLAWSLFSAAIVTAVLLPRSAASTMPGTGRFG